MGVLTSIKQTTKTGLGVLGGMSVGAGLMYFFDPDRGRRRRTQAIDQLTEAIHETGESLDRGLRDLNNRVSGAAMEAVSMFVPDHPDDTVLTNRIRAMLGRCVSYPHAIDVKADGGHVTLTGHILMQEQSRLIAALRCMRSVRDITDEMKLHVKPGEVPDMQGKPRVFRDHSMEPQLTPARRVGIAAAGSFLAVYGTARRGLFGFGCGVIGLGMVARALKAPPSHSFGHGDSLERGVDLQKTITIDAPLERVFKLLANPENFPRFMSHVHEVKRIDDRLYRWAVVGPAGAVAHWDAEITRLVDNEVLEWTTTPGSSVDHAGVVRCDPTPYGSTRVHVRVSFRPPLGALGITLGELFSLYPKQMLDEDLARLKSLLEQGKTTAHHEKIRLEEVLT